MADEWLKELLESMQTDLKRIEYKIDKQNGRIRSLEIWRGYLIGIGSIIALLVALAVKYVI